MTVRLLAIVGVSYEDRIVCQAQGCGHSVYRRIHVVRDEERFVVLGSECYKRLYGGGKIDSVPAYGGVGGRNLTAEERQALLDNTERFIATLEAEHNAAELARIDLEKTAQEEAARRAQVRSGFTSVVRNREPIWAPAAHSANTPTSLRPEPVILEETAYQVNIPRYGGMCDLVWAADARRSAGQERSLRIVIHHYRQTGGFPPPISTIPFERIVAEAESARLQGGALRDVIDNWRQNFRLGDDISPIFNVLLAAKLVVIRQRVLNVTP